MHSSKSVFGRLGAKIVDVRDDADPLNNDVINELDENTNQRFGKNSNKALLDRVKMYKEIEHVKQELVAQLGQKKQNDLASKLLFETDQVSPEEDVATAIDREVSRELSGDDVSLQRQTSSPATVPPAQERVALKYNPKPRKRFDSNDSSSPNQIPNVAPQDTQFDPRLRTNNRDPRSVSNGPVPLPGNSSNCNPFNPFVKHPSHTLSRPPHASPNAPPHTTVHPPPNAPMHVPPHAVLHPTHGPMHLAPVGHMLSSNGLPMRNHQQHPSQPHHPPQPHPNFFMQPNRQMNNNHFNDAPMFVSPNESNQFAMHSPPVGTPFHEGSFFPNIPPRRPKQTYADHKRELEKRRECVSSTSSSPSTPATATSTSTESILVTTTTQPITSPTTTSTPAAATTASSVAQNSTSKPAPIVKRRESTKRDMNSKSSAPSTTKSISDNAFRGNNWNALSAPSGDNSSKKAAFKIPKLNRSDSSEPKSSSKSTGKESYPKTSNAKSSSTDKSKESKRSRTSLRRRIVSPPRKSSRRETAIATSSSSSASSSPVPVTESDEFSKTATKSMDTCNVADKMAAAPDVAKMLDEILTTLLKPNEEIPSTIGSLVSAEKMQQLKALVNKNAATNVDDSAVSSSTAIAAEKPTKSQLEPPQPENEPKLVRKPRRNELEKLQENLDSTFIRDEVMTATGKRACTLEQNQRTAVAKKQATPPKPKAKGAQKNAIESDTSSGTKSFSNLIQLQ